MSADPRDEDKEEEFDEANQAEKMFRSNFNLNVALDALKQDSPTAMAALAKDEAQLTKVRQVIQQQSRKNFVLERELAVIEEKIGLLVKNRISVEEAAKAFMKDDDKNDVGHSPIQGKRDQYEALFYILQSKPHYFAKLTRLLDARDVPMFVQTVVFDMFGDQYDTREERLLLDLFKRVLKDELDAAENRGSLLRANRCIIQMLSAYAKRGQGTAILKEILGPALKDLLTKHKDLNLEIDPGKVYRSYVQDVETQTGQKCDWPLDVDAATAASKPEVAQIIKERAQQLLQWCETFLQRILDSADSIPYGMRWICKQLGALCKARFPDSTRFQMGSLMGGYIYLRFFNPVIVNPDGANIVSNKPTRTQRRNLILIAKVLQNLSDGLEFGDKEEYMKACNVFIGNKKEPLMAYFDHLTQVEDLSDSLQVDRYLEHTATSNNISLSYNQMFMVHRLLLEHMDVVARGTTDPIRQPMRELGIPSDNVPRDENRTVVLQLKSRKQLLSTIADAFAIKNNNEVNPLYFQAKALLLSVLRLLPFKTASSTLEEFLEHEKAAAVKAEDSSLADHITNVVTMLHTMASMGLLRDMGSTKDTFNFFLWEIASDAMDRQKRTPLVKKRLAMVKPAVENIQQHHDHLMLRLDMYKTYLENVRRGAGNTIQEKLEKDTNKKDKKQKVLEYKAKHSELVNAGVIMSIDPSISSGLLKSCYYLFKMPEPGKFEITVHVKKGFEIRLVKKPIVLVLEDLLTMQDHGETRLPLEYLDLNVNLLIHLLNIQLGGRTHEVVQQMQRQGGEKRAREEKEAELKRKREAEKKQREEEAERARQPFPRPDQVTEVALLLVVLDPNVTEVHGSTAGPFVQKLLFLLKKKRIKARVVTAKNQSTAQADVVGLVYGAKRVLYVSPPEATVQSAAALVHASALVQTLLRRAELQRVDGVVHVTFSFNLVPAASRVGWAEMLHLLEGNVFQPDAGMSEEHYLSEVVPELLDRMQVPLPATAARQTVDSTDADAARRPWKSTTKKEVQTLLAQRFSHALLGEAKRSDMVRLPAVKLYTLGNGEVGKSTLLLCLQGEEPNPYMPRTPHVVIGNVWTQSPMGAPPSPVDDVNWVLCDFPGQPEFYATNGNFLSAFNSIILVVVDLTGVATLPLQLQQWMGKVNSTARAQGLEGRVFVVGTRKDMLSASQQATVDRDIVRTTSGLAASLKHLSVLGTYCLDARDVQQAQGLRDALLAAGQQVLRLSQGVPQSVVDLTQELKVWRTNTPSRVHPQSAFLFRVIEYMQAYTRAAVERKAAERQGAAAALAQAFAEDGEEERQEAGDTADAAYLGSDGPDNKSSKTCTLCSKSFNMFRWKKVCFSCEQPVCAACSEKAVVFSKLNARRAPKVEILCKRCAKKPDDPATGSGPSIAEAGTAASQSATQTSTNEQGNKTERKDLSLDVVSSQPLQQVPMQQVPMQQAPTKLKPLQVEEIQAQEDDGDDDDDDEDDDMHLRGDNLMIVLEGLGEILLLPSGLVIDHPQWLSTLLGNVVAPEAVAKGKALPTINGVATLSQLNEHVFATEDFRAFPSHELVDLLLQTHVMYSLQQENAPGDEYIIPSRIEDKFLTPGVVRSAAKRARVTASDFTVEGRFYTMANRSAIIPPGFFQSLMSKCSSLEGAQRQKRTEVALFEFLLQFSSGVSAPLRTCALVAMDENRIAVVFMGRRMCRRDLELQCGAFTKLLKQMEVERSWGGVAFEEQSMCVRCLDILTAAHAFSDWKVTDPKEAVPSLSACIHASSKCRIQLSRGDDVHRTCSETLSETRVVERLQEVQDGLAGYVQAADKRSVACVLEEVECPVPSGAQETVSTYLQSLALSHPASTGDYFTAVGCSEAGEAKDRPEALQLEPGSVVSLGALQFRVGRLLAKGKFKVAHLATGMAGAHKHQTVVLSVVSLVGWPKQGQVTEAELEMLQSLPRHPHLVQFIAGHITDSAVYIVTHYASAGTLQTVCDEYFPGVQVPEDPAHQYAHDVLQGLKVLHDNSIVHCDVKADNVLKNIQGDLQLADFGLSRLVNDTGCARGSMAFLRYIDPEMLQDDGSFMFSRETDVYMFGIMMLRLLTHREPYHDTRDQQALLELLRARTPPPELQSHFAHLSATAQDFVTQCLRVQAERPSCEQLLAHPFLAHVVFSGGGVPCSSPLVRVEDAYVVKKSSAELLAMSFDDMFDASKDAPMLQHQAQVEDAVHFRRVIFRADVCDVTMDCYRHDRPLLEEKEDQTFMEYRFSTNVQAQQLAHTVGLLSLRYREPDFVANLLADGVSQRCREFRCFGQMANSQTATGTNRWKVEFEAQIRKLRQQDCTLLQILPTAGRANAFACPEQTCDKRVAAPEGVQTGVKVQLKCCSSFTVEYDKSAMEWEHTLMKGMSNKYAKRYFVVRSQKIVQRF